MYAKNRLLMATSAQVYMMMKPAQSVVDVNIVRGRKDTIELSVLYQTH